MAETFEDLFKSELEAAKEPALLDCPHCGGGITKSYVMGKVSAGGKSKATVADANDASGTSVGEHSSALAEVVHPETGATGEPTVYPGAQGVNAKRGKITKSEDQAPPQGIVRGTPYYQIVDTGEDQWIADQLAQGRLGAGVQQMPIDRGQSPTRNIGGAFGLRRT